MVLERKMGMPTLILEISSLTDSEMQIENVTLHTNAELKALMILWFSTCFLLITNLKNLLNFDALKHSSS